MFIRGNTLPLKVNLSRDDFDRLVHLHRRGEIHVSISVSHGERVGFLPMDDLDITRTTDDQLSLEFP